jgi:hypothetical protein
MSMRFTRRLRSCPALVLLGLACARPGADACAEGPDCAELGGGEPSSALISMPAGSAPPSGCGDGIRERDEECDDGSACRDGRDCTEESARCQVGGGDRSCAPRAGDGCSAECRLESGYECPELGPCQRLAVPPAASEAPAALPLSPAPAPSSNQGGGALGAAGSASTSAPLPLPPQPPRAQCEIDRFEEPERVQGLEPSLLGIDLGGLQLWAPALSSDGATLFFAAAQPGLPERIFSATRSPRGRRFAEAGPLVSLDSGTGDGTPLLSQDGLRLYFYSRRPGGAGDRDLWQARRSDPGAEFGAPAPLAAVNSPALEHLPWLSADELTLLFVSTRPGGAGQSDVWLAQRAAPEGEFAQPSLLSVISSSADEGRAVLSSSGRALIFASDRAGGQGLQDLWLATLSGEGSADPEQLRPLSELNGPGMDLDPFLSLDERELFFVSDRDGRPEIWRAQRECED